MWLLVLLYVTDRVQYYIIVALYHVCHHSGFNNTFSRLKTRFIAERT